MPEDRAQAFLHMIRRSQRGRLKVYLGYGPGVGKTFQMLTEAHRLKREGIDVVVGLVETHDRAETSALVEGLELVPRRKVEYHGITVEEMDLDGVLARNPQVVVVDELAHTNAPGSRNAKRYQDVQDILAAGIHVISAMNIQHLESLYNTVEQLVSVKVRERVPDAVLAEADQVVNIDLAAQDLQKRLTDGKIYPRDRIQSSLSNFFTESNLEHLRELTMRELAAQLDARRRELRDERAGVATTVVESAPDQIMVCLSSRGPNTARLLRFGSRLAGRLNRNWYAVYVQTPKEEPTVIDARTQRMLGDQLTLANQLGATVFTFKGQDVADTILRFAAEYRVGQVVIGRPRPVPWYKRLTGERSVAEELIHRARGVTVVVVDAETDSSAITQSPPATTSTGSATGVLTRLLTVDRVLIWDDPVTRNDVRRSLVDAVAATTPGLSAPRILQKLAEREALGSTFLNEGVALPHARLEELDAPQVALGLTHAGVLDVATEKPIEAIFLLLSPATGASVHLQLLSRFGRALQDRGLRRALAAAESPEAAVAAIQDFEAASSPAAARAGRA
jgi:two-component system sensor histidine kinase KdpD